MHSSYAQNNYGEVFRAIVRAFKPVVLVELGVLEGYSTLSMLNGILDNRRTDGVRAKLCSFDLFEAYPYRNAPFAAMLSTLYQWGKENNCDPDEICSITGCDAWTVHEKFHPGTVDLLHVDLSNDGQTIDRVLELWDSRMRVGGIILFEGGTSERDQVEWMLKYNKRPIKQALEENKIISGQYIMGTYLPFPGLTMLLKKRNQDEVC